MKLKYNFVISEVAGKKVAVATGGDLASFNGFLKMNDTAAFIFELLKNEISEEEIVAKVKENFDGVTEEELKKYVADFLEKLRQEDVLE